MEVTRKALILKFLLGYFPPLRIRDPLLIHAGDRSFLDLNYVLIRGNSESGIPSSEENQIGEIHFE